MADEVYIHSVACLRKEHHHQVVQSLNLLMSYDVLYRRVVAENVTGGEVDKKYLSEPTFNFVILSQALMNNFRTSLLVEIANFLTERYDSVGQQISTNVQSAMAMFRHAKNLNDHYRNHLVKWFAKEPIRDEHTRHVYQECQEALNEVHLTGTIHLQRLLQEQLRKVPTSRPVIMLTPYPSSP